MRSRLLLLLLLPFLLLPTLSTPALAQAPEPAKATIDFSKRAEGERARTLEDLSDEEALQLRPMLQRIRLALLTQRATLKDLDERRTKTTNSEVRAQLDREVASVKMGTERRLLEIQLEFAIADGRDATAETLEQALEILDENPEPIYQDRSQSDLRR